MRFTRWLEAWFEPLHCQSQFAHFCLLLLLLFLAYSFACGVQDELQQKDTDDLLREQERCNKAAQRSGQVFQTSSAASSKIASQQVGVAKDYSALQSETNLKAEQFSMFFREQMQMEGYKFECQRDLLNGCVHSKDEQFLRLDGVAEQSSRVLFELFSNYEKYPQWLKTQSVKCIANKKIDTLSTGSEVYQMTLDTDTRGKLDFIYKRCIRQVEKRHSYQVIFTSRGLENYQSKKNTNKRLNIAMFGINLFQQNSGDEYQNLNGAKSTTTFEPIEEEGHARVFCLMKLQKEEDRTQDQKLFMANFLADFVESAMVGC